MRSAEEQYGRGIAGREVALTAALPREECPYCQACPEVPCVLHRDAEDEMAAQDVERREFHGVDRAEDRCGVRRAFVGRLILFVACAALFALGIAYAVAQVVKVIR